MDDKTILKTWGIMLVVFIVIALVAVSAIFATPINHMKYTNQFTQEEEEFVISSPAFSTLGAVQRLESWKEYPDYHARFGIIGVIAGVGVLYSLIRIAKVRVNEKT